MLFRKESTEMEIKPKKLVKLVWKDCFAEYAERRKNGRGFDGREF